VLCVQRSSVGTLALAAPKLTQFDCSAVGLNGYVVLGSQLWSPLLCKPEVPWLPKLADPMQSAA